MSEATRAAQLPSPLRGALLAGRLHWKTSLRGGRRWLGPLILAVPIFFTLLARLKGQRINFFEESIAPYTLFGGLALLLPLLYSGGAWADEVERKTITYLLLRPVPRAALYLGKVLASALLVAALLLGAELICFGSILTAYEPDIIVARLSDLWHHALALLLLALSYGALFSFIGVWLPRFSLLVGIAYGAIAEVLLPELPVSYKYITIQHYVRAVAGSDLGTERPQAVLILLAVTLGFSWLGASLASRRDYAFGD